MLFGTRFTFHFLLDQWVITPTFALSRAEQGSRVASELATRLLDDWSRDATIWPGLVDLHDALSSDLIVGLTTADADEIKSVLADALKRGQLAALRSPRDDAERQKPAEDGVVMKGIDDLLDAATDAKSLVRILKPIKDKSFLDVTLVRDNGKPLSGRRFKLQLPNGLTETGTLGSDGRIFRNNIDPGTARLTLLGPSADAVDAADFESEGAGPSFFAVRLVDDRGADVDNIALNLNVSGKQHNLTTAQGRVRVEGVEPGNATVTLGDVAAARKALAARQATLGFVGSSKSSAPNVLPAKADSDPVEIASDSEQVIIVSLPPKELNVVEVEDGMFRLDSAVVLPEAERPSPDTQEALTAVSVFTTALLFAAANSSKKSLVAGHTDTSGTESHNQDLSVARAQCALACLEGGDANRQKFGEVCDARHKVSDYKQILAWAAAEFGFSSDPGTIDDVEFTGIEPIKAFQRDYNASRAALGVPSADELKVDGSMGPKTWRAIFDCYEAALAKELSEATDPAARLKDLADFRKKLNFLDQGKKSQGYGEHHTIDKIGQDNVRSQANRRVELLYFDVGEEPDLSQSPKDSEIYRPGFYKRIHIDPATAAQLVELRIVDGQGQVLPNVAVTLTIGQTKRSGQADGGGLKTEFLPGAKKSVVVDWRDGSGQVFSREIFLDVDGQTPTERRFHNLGFVAGVLSEQIETFRVDFARSGNISDGAVTQEASAWHDGGSAPTRGKPLVASSQTFPDVDLAVV